MSDWDFGLVCESQRSRLTNEGNPLNPALGSKKA
jgi:hypothetical protein